MSLGLWWRTVRRLHPAQLLLRPVHVARMKLLAKSPWLCGALAGTPAVRWADAIDGTLPTPVLDRDEELARAQAALDGYETLVGRRWAVAPAGNDFALVGEPKLVRYQRGYLGIARSLAVAARCGPPGRRDEASRLAVDLVRDFVDRWPPGPGDAWEPYVVSLRLLNLTSVRELLSSVSSPDDRAFLDGQLALEVGRHARWLCATLEGHLLGNHLFSNGAALYVAGAALQGEGAALWRRLGRWLVERSLAVDVLEDGGHVERSPMYQAIVAAQLRRVAQVASRRGDAIADRADAAAERMEAMLADIVHPDGSLPIFGDTAAGEAPTALAPRDQRPRRRHFPQTGILAFRDGGEQLVIDAGPLGSDDQPGHAHADALSFELSHEGRRVVVDGGAGHYASDAWRAYFRGPFAHNGVSVDGEGCDELWGAFRAGGRARVSPLAVSRDGAFDIVDGELVAHAGWRWRRRFVYAPGRVLVVVDRVEAHAGAVVRSHALFDPSVVPDARERDSWGLGSMRLVPLVGGDLIHRRGDAQAMRGFVSRRFGVFEPASAFELQAVAAGRSFIAAWALVMDDHVRLATTTDAITVNVDGETLRLDLSQAAQGWARSVVARDAP